MYNAFHPLNNSIIVVTLTLRLEVALENMGFTSLFPVQVAVWQETIGPGSCERDLCINSPTGSGKTLAYALPIVQMLSTRAVRCLRVLVVLPTRDLAVLVKEVFAAIAPAVSLSVGLAVGQSSIADEISELIKRPKLEAGICYDPEDLSLDLESSVDILVATPGRLMDHINSTKGFTLEHVCYLSILKFMIPPNASVNVFQKLQSSLLVLLLVVDETDRLLREAYQSWLPTVLQLIQSSVGSLFPHANTFFPSPVGYLKTRRRSGVERGFKGNSYPRLVKMVLSATLTQDPCKLAQLNLHHPLSLTTGQRRYQLPEQLESFKLFLGSFLVSFVRSLNNPNLFNSHVYIIFEWTRRYIMTFLSTIMTSTMRVSHERCLFKNYIVILLFFNRVKRFKKLLQKADNNYCPVHSVPSDSIESFRSTYTSESVKSETYRKHKFKFKSSGMVKGKENNSKA
ncbi:hypothetical protein CsSME_00043282 [Camellia sinensis var. sinensis]